MIQNNVQNSSVVFEKNNVAAINRVTAIWGFSEAALGGILHAFSIPFTGLFIGGSAVLFISLIALLSEKKGTILKTTFIVIIIKGIVSPHTPVTAYLAVFLQGLAGEIFFYNRKFFKLSAMLLGIFSLLYSSFQKLIILTLIFGNSLWESINLFFNFIVGQFSSFIQIKNINFSLIIIGIYVGLHLIGGILAGIWAGNLPSWLKGKVKELDLNKIENNFISDNKTKKHKRWWKKKSGVILFLFFIMMIILSFLFPEIGKDKATKVLIMIIRSISILLVWYLFLSPLILKMIRKLLQNKQTFYSKEIEDSISFFPKFRLIISYCWQESSNLKGLVKIKTFISNSLAVILLANYTNE